MELWEHMLQIQIKDLLGITMRIEFLLFLIYSNLQIGNQSTGLDAPSLAYTMVMEELLVLIF